MLLHTYLSPLTEVKLTPQEGQIHVEAGIYFTRIFLLDWLRTFNPKMDMPSQDLKLRFLQNVPWGPCGPRYKYIARLGLHVCDHASDMYHEWHGV